MILKIVKYKMDQVWKLSIETLPGEPADELQNKIWHARPKPRPPRPAIPIPEHYYEWCKKNKRVLDQLMLVW